MSDFLAVTRRQLLELARRAARAAYCPYSGFHVGAALLADDGRLFTGANVENASYGLTLCAERTALFAAAAAGVRRVRALAVTCPDAAADSAAVYRMPCGACRQVIAEFAAPELRVFVDGVADYSIDGLLPQAFRLDVPERTPPAPAARPRLYIDVDNVLSGTDERMRALIEQVTGGRVRLAYEHMRAWDYRECEDASGQRVTEAEWRAVHDEGFAVADVVAALGPLDRAAEEMGRLAATFDVSYVTARPAALQPATQGWLSAHGFPVGPTLFIGRGEKHLAIRGAFALVEDDREQAEAAALDGMHAVLLAHPWNATGPGSLAHRCPDWSAVRALLLDLVGG